MRRAPLLLLAPVAAGRVACGGAGETVTIGASAAAIRQAGETTLAADSARMDMTMTMDLGELLPGADESIELTASGITDFAGGRSEVDIDMSAMFEQFADLLPEGPGRAQVAAMFSGGLRQIQDGTVLYQCGAMYEQFAGAECIRIDLEEVPGFDATQLGGASPADAAALLESLQGTDGEVEEVGEEDIDGVRTTHLRGSFTLAAAIDELPADAAEEMQAAYEQMGLEGAFDDEQQIDVWIDDQGRVRQLRQDLGFGGDDGFGAIVEVRYSDFGTDVEIELPEDFVDGSELLGVID